MMTKFMVWTEKQLRQISDSASAAINRYSRPRNEIATASSIGHCDFKVAFEAQNGSQEFDFSTMVRFRVGHIFELDLAMRLIAGGFTPVEPDEILTATGPCFCGGGDLLEICGISAEARKILRQSGVKLPTEQLTLEDTDAECGANYDFVIKHKDGSYVVIETKTTEADLVEAKPEWVDQIHTQLAILFSHVPAGTKIRGSIYARMGNAREEEFEGFSVPTPSEWAQLRIKAKHQAAAKRGEVEGCKAPSHLCGLCHAHTCPLSPAGRSKKALPLPADVALAAENFKTASDLAKSFTAEADRAKQILLDYAGDKRMQAIAGDQMVLVSPVAGRFTVNQKKLSTLVDPSVLEACSSRGKGYMKVEIKPLPAEAFAE